MKNTLLYIPFALWEAPLDMPETVLLATSKTMRETLTTTPDQARQFRKIKEITPCD